MSHQRSHHIKLSIVCQVHTYNNNIAHILMLQKLSGPTARTKTLGHSLLLLIRNAGSKSIGNLGCAFPSFGLCCLIYKAGIIELTVLFPLRVFCEVNSSHSQGHSPTSINNSWMLLLVRISKTAMQ